MLHVYLISKQDEADDAQTARDDDDMQTGGHEAAQADEESASEVEDKEWNEYLTKVANVVHDFCSEHLPADVKGEVLHAIEHLRKPMPAPTESGGLPRSRRRVIFCTAVVKRGWQLRVAAVVNTVFMALTLQRIQETFTLSLTWMLVLSVDEEAWAFQLD